MIPDDFIAQLLSRVDIVEVIDRSVPLKKAGANYSACCPFHKEKSPSFTVSPTKQFYHCFGCGAHGSAIKFLMEYAGKTFPDAVEELAQGVGLTVPRDNERKADPSAGPLFDAMIVAANFYKSKLKTSPVAIEYFKKRGVSGEIAKRFHLGWATADWQGLEAAFEDYLDNELLLTGGLVKLGDANRRYDTFRERVMFPILNQQGAVIGFGGRILGAKDEQSGPKYLNSPETPIFSKGRELYGLFQAQASIRKANRVMVVEGYMDVIALAQYGVEYVVATLGTATTEAHTQRLLRLADEVVFSFDGDAAGQRAAWRALENALPALRDGKQVRFLFLPTEHDPDSYVREHGREAFEKFIDSALPLSQYWLRELNAKHPGDSAEAKAARAAEARKHLELVSAPMLRESLAKALEADVNIAAHTLLPPIKAKPVEANRDEDFSPRTKYVAKRPLMPRNDVTRSRVLSAARRLLTQPKFAMHLVDLQLHPSLATSHTFLLLKMVADVTNQRDFSSNYGTILERFSNTEYANEIKNLLTREDEEVASVESEHDVELELRKLRQETESGTFPGFVVGVSLPQHHSSVGGIVSALARPTQQSGDHPLPPLRGTLSPEGRGDRNPLPPGGGGVGERGRASLQKHPGITIERRKELINNAKDLRTNQTPHENELWYELRANRFTGAKFKRQQPIGNYIVDFVALSEKLVIELDGGQHAENVAYDRERDMFLMSEGYRVLRIWNSEWSTNRAGVLDTIYFALFPEAKHHPLPSLRDTLPPQGGGEETDDLIDDDLDDIPFDDHQKFAPPPDEDHPPF